MTARARREAGSLGVPLCEKTAGIALQHLDLEELLRVAHGAKRKLKRTQEPGGGQAGPFRSLGKPIETTAEFVEVYSTNGTVVSCRVEQVAVFGLELATLSSGGNIAEKLLSFLNSFEVFERARSTMDGLSKKCINQKLLEFCKDEELRELESATVVPDAGMDDEQPSWFKNLLQMLTPHPAGP
ncbi:hypothetical protein NDN08_006292 [Rhodosorus marinus]|uniref:Uncharacterized protein n=1 Tax=Rhodosorus marinus TaxID=101924 RepID=A0AAV8UKA2_9RHOD|nr:hypothetical protein NDN08_006292 [Rhodosorus marinus]